MSLIGLEKSQGGYTKEHPVRSYLRVIKVSIVISESLIKKIRDSQSNKTVAFRQTIIEAGVNGPKVRTARRKSTGEALKHAVLIVVRRRQRQTYAGGMEKAEPYRNTMCVHVFDSIR